MDELLYLTDENGNETAFEVLDVVEWGDDDYAVLFPADGGDGAVLLQILPAEAGEAETFVGVDEDTMQAVFQKFRELHKDELQ
ncbi:MAG: DUF1292 domain-containing protein [Ruminococcaceae bacterium]|nr:DUF1292 domain-containing protein [Oscillospiraceae bacterium]